ncbi:MAG: hypothetical protein QM763_00475 [Agriterribacter sp.]
MEWLNFILIASGALLIIYICIQVFRFSYLQKKLNHTNLDGYKKVLGENYRSKPIDQKTRRYKWEKGFFIIRAHFDEKGNLVGTQNISTRIFHKKKDRVLN